MAKNGYIGRVPGDSSVIIARKTYEPTGIQTDFTFTAGYQVGYCDVYVNGVRLIASNDYTAQNGSTVGLTSYANSGDIVEIIAYKAFNIGSVDSATANFDIGGNLDVTGVTTGLSAYYTGVVTATSFSGSGANLTGVANTDFINAAAINVLGITTSVDLRVSGGSTFVGVSNFSAAINADATTDSTSTSTGALIVDGGVGIAKNVYIGAGLSIAGTLTYEDVTNVDSVGLITAKSGVNVSGGELTVGSGITMGIAGVATFSGTADVHLLDSVELKVGDGSDLKIYHNGSHNYIESTNGNTILWGGGNQLKAMVDGAVEVYYDNSKKWETTNDGTVTTGISTATSVDIPTGGAFTVGSGITVAATSGVVTFSDGSNVTNGLHFGSGADLRIYADGSNSRIDHNGDGNLRIFSGGAESIKCTEAAGTHLFHNGTEMCYTVNNGLKFNDNKYITLGTGGDFRLHHDGSDNYISGDVDGMDLFVRSRKDVTIQCGDNSSGYHNVLYADNNGHNRLYHPAADAERLRTTTQGIKVTGFTSTTAGMGVTGGLFEGAFIKAGKLSDNKTLGISTANVFYFTTAETTTGTPDIRWNDSYTLSSKMKVGDVASVTVITTAAAAGYSANWTIDGNAVTEEWVGGSAPSAGGADGLDIYSLTIIKTGTGTGDSGFKVIANVSNAT
tara:strand:+ start:3986 stop:6007 length:2022 start_codon:yes stop_codon:yes gene_type:complete